MPTDSHRQRVIAAIRISSLPLDDDQLAARTGISPRQGVNQICRALEPNGMVRRLPGPDGKIVNEWLGNHDQDQENPSPSAAAVPGTGAGVAADGDLTDDARAVPAGDSNEQRRAERVMRWTSSARSWASAEPRHDHGSIRGAG